MIRHMHLPIPPSLLRVLQMPIDDSRIHYALDEHRYNLVPFSPHRLEHLASFISPATSYASDDSDCRWVGESKV